MMKIFECILPIKTVSEANRRDHWTVKHRRAASQRLGAYIECRANFGLIQIPDNARVLIELTRCASRRMDSDNLAISAKHCRDGIADYLKIDDGSERLTWSYAQELKSKANEIKLRITISDS
jgi:hypothetical protein